MLRSGPHRVDGSGAYRLLRSQISTQVRPLEALLCRDTRAPGPEQPPTVRGGPLTTCYAALRNGSAMKERIPDRTGRSRP
jgi:hypothetical protein